MILAVGSIGCEKDTNILPTDAEKYLVDLPAEMINALPEAEVVAYLGHLAEVDLLTPEGYEMIPIAIPLAINAASYYEYDEAGDPFSVKLSGEGYWEEVGLVSFFEIIDLIPDHGVVKGSGRIEYLMDVDDRCVPDDPTLYFATFPAEKWNPMPVGNYDISAPVLIKSGKADFAGAYGEATRTVTFIEGQFDKGVGYLYGYVFIPEVAPK